MTTASVTSPAAADEQAITALLERLRRAHRDKDAVAMAALLCPGCRNLRPLSAAFASRHRLGCEAIVAEQPGRTDTLEPREAH
jgi:hypothetical protein